MEEELFRVDVVGVVHCLHWTVHGKHIPDWYVCIAEMIYTLSHLFCPQTVSGDMMYIFLVLSKHYEDMLIDRNDIREK